MYSFHQFLIITCEMKSNYRIEENCIIKLKRSATHTMQFYFTISTFWKRSRFSGVLVYEATTYRKTNKLLKTNVLKVSNKNVTETLLHKSILCETIVFHGIELLH